MYLIGKRGIVALSSDLLSHEFIVTKPAPFHIIYEFKKKTNHDHVFYLYAFWLT